MRFATQLFPGLHLADVSIANTQGCRRKAKMIRAALCAFCVAYVWSRGIFAVAAFLLLRSPMARRRPLPGQVLRDALFQLALCNASHIWTIVRFFFFCFVLCVTDVLKMLTARFVQSSAVATKCVDSRSLFFPTVCCFFFLNWFAIILSGQETETI